MAHSHPPDDGEPGSSGGQPSYDSAPSQSTEPPSSSLPPPPQPDPGGSNGGGGSSVIARSYLLLVLAATWLLVILPLVLVLWLGLDLLTLALAGGLLDHAEGLSDTELMVAFVLAVVSLVLIPVVQKVRRDDVAPEPAGPSGASGGGGQPPDDQHTMGTFTLLILWTLAAAWLDWGRGDLFPDFLLAAPVFALLLLATFVLPFILISWSIAGPIVRLAVLPSGVRKRFSGEVLGPLTSRPVCFGTRRRRPR